MLQYLYILMPFLKLGDLIQNMHPYCFLAKHKLPSFSMGVNMHQLPQISWIIPAQKASTLASYARTHTWAAGSHNSAVSFTSPEKKPTKTDLVIFGVFL